MFYRNNIFCAMALLIMCLLLVCAVGASEDNAGVPLGSVHAHRQKKFVKYAQGVSAAIAALMGDSAAEAEYDDYEDALADGNTPFLPDPSAAASSIQGWAKVVQRLWGHSVRHVETRVDHVAQLSQAALGFADADDAAGDADHVDTAKVKSSNRLAAEGVARGGKLWEDYEILTCEGGHEAFTEDTTFSCDGFDGRLLTVNEYAQRAAHTRAKCHLATGSYACVCSLDKVGVLMGDTVYCESRYLDVRPSLAPEHLCQDPVNTPFGLPETNPSDYCVTASRNGVLQLNVTWTYRWLTDDEMNAAIGSTRKTVFYDPVADDVVLFFWDTPWIKGTYRELRGIKGFHYLMRPPPLDQDDDDQRFVLTADNTIFDGNAATTKLYSFGYPEYMEPFNKITYFTPETYVAFFGNPNGVTSHVVTYDLSLVPDAFVEGNQMYLETGAAGGRVFQQFRVARVHVTLTDVKEPSTSTYKYKRAFNVLYIALIALAGAVVVGIALAILWCYCQRPDEPDDAVVTTAQRHKQQKRDKALEEKKNF